MTERRAGEFVHDLIAAPIATILDLEPNLLGDPRPEDVHAFRVAARRLRSDLRTFRPLLEREWVDALRDDLDWLIDTVGAVRDSDVLLARLHDHICALDVEDAVDAEPLVAAAAKDRAAAVVELQRALRSQRRDDVIESLRSAASQPKFAADEDLDAPAKDVAARRTGRAWKKLQSAAREADDEPSETQLHAIRIASKRCRYAAEAAIPVIGRRARRFARGIARVQAQLGDQRDAIVAERWLRDTADGGRAGGVSAGLLIARQRDECRSLDRTWRDAWRKASRRKRRRWLR